MMHTRQREAKNAIYDGVFLIEVDGSYLEGGGQILRTSVALSSVTGKPFKIYNIRKGRDRSGLKHQHLKAIELVSKISRAKVKGASIGSSNVEFFPGSLKGGKYKVDIGTAGSITLLLHAVIPPCLYLGENVDIELVGGTNVPWSPTTDFFRHVFCNFLDRMGVFIRVDVKKHGFYPRGGGKIRVLMEPRKRLKKLNLTERGKFKRIDVWSISSKDLKDRKVSERQLSSFKEKLKMEGHEHAVYTDTLSTGTSIHAHAHYTKTKLGADVLGQKGIPAEKIGSDCAEVLKKQMESGACLDEWMADQILPYMAISGGGKVSVAEVTEHSKSNMWVIEKFLPVKFKIRKNIISCYKDKK